MDTQVNDDNQNPQIQVNEALLNEAEALIWKLLDDQIETADLQQLENLIRENEQVRQRYFTCVQMHADLHKHFKPQELAKALEELPISPVLGSLGDLQPSTDSFPPVIE